MGDNDDNDKPILGPRLIFGSGRRCLVAATALLLVVAAAAVVVVFPTAPAQGPAAAP
jgi:hypothetical protein